MKDVFYKSFNSTFPKSVWVFFGGGAGSLIAIMLFCKNVFDLKPILSIEIGLGFIFAFYFLRFCYNFFRYLNQYLFFAPKEYMYGDAIIILKDAFSRIHWLRNQTDLTEEAFIAALVFMCNQLKQIFDKKTNSKCSVSIKVPIENLVTADTEVKNLCRDKNSIHRDTDSYKSIQHRIFCKYLL